MKDTIFPRKLRAGDGIRVIAPATTLARLSSDQIASATEVLRGMGLVVSVSRNAFEKNDYMSSSVESRLADLHDAFSDPNIAAVITTLGGLNTNQLIDLIDYNLVKENPKVLCGFSDITALQIAIYSKTGLVSYSGPHFATFSRKNTLDYSIQAFRQCLLCSKPFQVSPGTYYTYDMWDSDPDQLNKIRETNLITLNSGIAEGTILGGNLSTLSLLIGTQFEPRARDVLLFIEDDSEVTALHFDRFMQSLFHSNLFASVRGVVIGRFERESEIGLTALNDIVSWHPELRKIPVIANAPFGHTSPIITFPIGGRGLIEAGDTAASIHILEH